MAAFDLGAFARDARGKRLALIVEGPTDRAILEEAWRKLRPGHSMPFAVHPGDGAKNIPRLLGPGSGRSGPLLTELSSAGTSLVGLFDFDHDGYGQWNGAISAGDAEEANGGVATACPVRKRRGQPVWAALLPVPDFRAGYASLTLKGDSRLTIELLFPDCHVEALLERVPVAGDGGTTRLAAVRAAQKKAVADAAARLPRGAFTAFEPILTLIEQVLGQPTTSLGGVPLTPTA